MRLSSRTRPFALVALVASTLWASGCHGTTSLEPSLMAGLYVLEAVSGRGPTTGTFILTAGAQAVRRIQYAPPAGGNAPEFTAVGSFQLLPDGVIAFALRENSGQSSHVWQVRGERSARSFSIRYPDAADGPDIVETYRRQ